MCSDRAAAGLLDSTLFKSSGVQIWRSRVELRTASTFLTDGHQFHANFGPVHATTQKDEQKTISSSINDHLLFLLSDSRKLRHLRLL